MICSGPPVLLLSGPAEVGAEISEALTGRDRNY